MTDAALPAMPDFPSFYRAVHGDGRDPFPWQVRLARRVAREGWPEEIGVPTGLGKTACLDVAVWWLALEADRDSAERRAPTRIWWVVNRRLLVDSTADHAKHLQKLLEDPGNQAHSGAAAAVLESVATRLSALSVSGHPLEVIRLRGGVRSETPADPAQPAILLSTIPMYGSRLLFRGYGVSRSMRPIEAAMAGTDSLVLLDEAHLAHHLTSLIQAAHECAVHSHPLPVPARSHPIVVALTATGDSGKGARFDLDQADEAHAVVRARLDAAKPVSLREVDGKIAKRLAAEVVALLDSAPQAASCLVFANTPATAREALGELRKQRWTGRDPDIFLLTGRMREAEARAVRKRVLDPTEGMPASRSAASARRRHLIAIATQTLEVGADLDAEYLVTETCGLRALVQRLGRLNRLGLHPHARGVYVHAPPPKTRGRSADGSDGATWPVYGAEPASVLERLESAVADSETDEIDLSPRRVRQVLGEPEDDPGRAPEILWGLLWEWIKTTTPPRGEALVEPYFSGIQRPESSVSVVWRAHLPADRDRLWPRARDEEALPVPIADVRFALRDRTDVLRRHSDGATVEHVRVEALRPGDVLLVPTDLRLMDEFGWNPASTEDVHDMSIEGSGLPLDAEALKRLCGASLGRQIGESLGYAADGEEIEPDDRTAAVDEILTEIRTKPPRGWEAASWVEFLDRLDRDPVTPANEVPRLRDPVSTRDIPRLDDLDEVSLAPPIALERHGTDVGRRAREISDRLGLPAELAETVELAACFHDVGKADRRFQRWLDPDAASSVPVAKSNTRRHRWAAARAAAGWPAGGRHEDLSARLVRAWLDQSQSVPDPSRQDLLLHLVISHHGKGRPLVPPARDGTDTAVRWTIHETVVEAPADLAVVDWEQPSRFWRLNRRYGPWGLALLEAIVRRADHAESGAASNVGGVH